MLRFNDEDLINNRIWTRRETMRALLYIANAPEGSFHPTTQAAAKNAWIYLNDILRTEKLREEIHEVLPCICKDDGEQPAVQCPRCTYAEALVKRLWNRTAPKPPEHKRNYMTAYMRKYRRRLKLKEEQKQREILKRYGITPKDVEVSDEEK